MDRRSLLKFLGAAGAAAMVLHPAASEAMPVAPRPADGLQPASAVATDKDLETTKPEKAYWGWHRRRVYWRRRYWRRRYWRRRVYWRPRYRYWRRRVYWRPRRVYWHRPVYWRPYRRVWW